MFELFTREQIGKRVITTHEMADMQREMMKNMGEDHPLYAMVKEAFERLWALRNDLARQFREYGTKGGGPPGH